MEYENELKLDKHEIQARLTLLPTDRHKALERLENVRTLIDPFSGHGKAASFDKNLPSDQEERLLEKLYKDLTKKYSFPSSRSDEIELALLESSYLLGNLELAKEHIDALLKNNPSNLFTSYYQANIHRIYERYSDSRELLESLFARTKDNAEWQIRLLGNLGLIAYLDREFLVSKNYFQQAISLCQENSLLSYLADTHALMGSLFDWLHDVNRADENYNRSLVIDISLNKQFAAIDTLLALGNLQLEARNYKKSEVYLCKAVSLAEVIQDKPTLGYCYASLQQVYESKQDWNKATNCADQALVVYSNLADNKRLIDVYHSIGDYHRFEGKLEEAESAFLNLLELAQIENDLQQIIFASGILHHHYLAISKLVVASKYQYLEEDALKEVKQNENSIEKLLLIASYYDVNHKSEVAESLCRRALNIATESNKPNDQALSYSELASVLEKLGKIEESKRAYLECERIYQSLGLRIETAKARNNLAHLLFSQGELEQAEKIYLNVLKEEKEFDHFYGVASTCCDLGHLYLMLGDQERSDKHFAQGKATYQAIGQNALAEDIDRFLEELDQEVV